MRSCFTPSYPPCLLLSTEVCTVGTRSRRLKDHPSLSSPSFSCLYEWTPGMCFLEYQHTYTYTFFFLFFTSVLLCCGTRAHGEKKGGIEVFQVKGSLGSALNMFYDVGLRPPPSSSRSTLLCLSFLCADPHSEKKCMCTVFTLLHSLPCKGVKPPRPAHPPFPPNPPSRR